MGHAYQYITSKTSPNQNARKSKIKSITIHHWGSRGQKFDNVVSWLCDKRAGTSAHYVAEAGKVACIVDPDRRAWHAGSSKGNHESIGIECRPEATEGDYATVAALVADLRAEYGNLPLVPHRSWTSTACPGVWDLGKLDRLARGVSIPAIPAGGASVPAPSKPASRPTQKPSPGKLTVDGRWGQATTRALQKRLGVAQDGRAGTGTFKALQRLLGAPYVDGQISRQSYKATELGNGIVPSAWGYTGRGSKGSQTIVLLQKRLGVSADGVVGSGTVKALQRALNDGRL